MRSTSQCSGISPSHSTPESLYAGYGLKRPTQARQLCDRSSPRPGLPRPCSSGRAPTPGGFDCAPGSRDRVEIRLHHALHAANPRKPREVVGAAAEAPREVAQRFHRAARARARRPCSALARGAARHQGDRARRDRARRSTPANSACTRAGVGQARTRRRSTSGSGTDISAEGATPPFPKPSPMLPGQSPRSNAPKSREQSRERCEARYPKPSNRHSRIHTVSARLNTSTA